MSAYVALEWDTDILISTKNLNHANGQYTCATDDYNTHNHDTVYYPKETADVTFWNDGNTTGSDADTIDGYHSSDLVGAAIPIGGIIAWENSEMPYGYAICNGQTVNSKTTPDLRDYFVPCKGATYTEGMTFGTNTVTISATISVAGHALSEAETPRHAHTYWDSYAVTSSNGSSSGWAIATTTQQDMTHTLTGFQGSDNAHGHPGSTISINNNAANNNMPLYYALYYIMRVI